MDTEPGAVAANTVYLSLVVPCFNEEAAIPLFYDETARICASLNEQSELIFVDDGSKDNTLDILRRLADQDGRVHYISFSRNFGKEAALLAGLQAAQGKYIATLDADGQDPPSLIPQMLKAVVSGEYDCAGTRRITRAGEPPVRSFFARCFYALMKKITNIEVIDGARDFRLMNRTYLEAILAMPERNRFSKGIFPWVGFKTKWFEYENIERTAGRTKWSFTGLFLYSLDGITAFSSKPLAVASALGMLLFLASLLLIIFIVIRKILWGDPVGGWASTACIILFCSGIQLLTTGILGQYMAKIYTEVKQRPQYIVREAR
ncbi:MAG: glycosyltransferase family 2 protein [Treponema sp.]|jgi:glycosyltransferase involved in cell wall biosynthesis|nr:glycosyltransferase family 2 protein [Treponema sp.]